MVRGLDDPSLPAPHLAERCDAAGRPEIDDLQDQRFLLEGLCVHRQLGGRRAFVFPDQEAIIASVGVHDLVAERAVGAGEDGQVRLVRRHQCIEGRAGGDIVSGPDPEPIAFAERELGVEQPAGPEREVARRFHRAGFDMPAEGDRDQSTINPDGTRLIGFYVDHPRLDPFAGCAACRGQVFEVEPDFVETAGIVCPCRSDKSEQSG